MARSCPHCSRELVRARGIDLIEHLDGSPAAVRPQFRCPVSRCSFRWGPSHPPSGEELRSWAWLRSLPQNRVVTVPYWPRSPEAEEKPEPSAETKVFVGLFLRHEFSHEQQLQVLDAFLARRAAVARPA
jgi:hypothetical protein